MNVLQVIECLKRVDTVAENHPELFEFEGIEGDCFTYVHVSKAVWSVIRLLEKLHSLKMSLFDLLKDM